MRTTRWVAAVLLLAVWALAGLHLHAETSHPCVVCKSVSETPTAVVALTPAGSSTPLAACPASTVPSVTPLTPANPRAPPSA